MKLKAGLHHMDASDLDNVAAEAELDQWKVFELDGRTAIDRGDSFFDSVRDSLPMDPPLQRNRSWDALSDSLWGGIDSLPCDKVLIIWRYSSTMASATSSDYEIAKEILNDVSCSLGRSDDTDGNTKEVCVIVT